MGKKRTFDFCDGDKDSAAQPDRHGEITRDRPKAAGEFFIDGWDAYDRWLDELRSRMDEARDKGR